MANYPSWVAEIGLQDGVNRRSTMAFYVPEATAKLYMAAADKAARDATAIGTFLTLCLTVTEMTEVYRRVYVQDLTSPVSALDDDILRGNKIVVGFQSGPKNFTMTIPGRDATAYTQKADSPEIDISAAGDFKTWYEAFETACLSIDGLSVDVTKAYLND
jgi:hypothetical protein